jgi:hypothetical protein
MPFFRGDKSKQAQTPHHAPQPSQISPDIRSFLLGILEDSKMLNDDDMQNEMI